MKKILEKKSLFQMSDAGLREREEKSHYCHQCYAFFPCTEKKEQACKCVHISWAEKQEASIGYYYCNTKCYLDDLLSAGYATQEEEESDFSREESSGEESERGEGKAHGERGGGETPD